MLRNGAPVLLSDLDCKLHLIRVLSELLNKPTMPSNGGMRKLLMREQVDKFPETIYQAR